MESSEVKSWNLVKLHRDKKQEMDTSPTKKKIEFHSKSVLVNLSVFQTYWTFYNHSRLSWITMRQEAMIVHISKKKICVLKCGFWKSKGSRGLERPTLEHRHQGPAHMNPGICTRQFFSLSLHSSLSGPSLISRGRWSRYWDETAYCWIRCVVRVFKIG